MLDQGDFIQLSQELVVTSAAEILEVWLPSVEGGRLSQTPKVAVVVGGHLRLVVSKSTLLARQSQ